MNGVIAFCGKKGSGKSTSCELFKQVYSGDIEEVALARHLKEASSRVFDIDIKYFLEPSLKEVELDTYIVLNKENLESLYKEFDVDNFTYDEHIRPHIGRVFMTPRKLLQYIGSDVFHPIDPLIHTKRALANRDSNKLTIITDLRFASEFEYLKSNFTEIFKPFYVKNSKAELLAASDTHRSEMELDLFKNECEVLQNESSITNLTAEIRKIVKNLGEE